MSDARAGKARWAMGAIWMIVLLAGLTVANSGYGLTAVGVKTPVSTVPQGPARPSDSASAIAAHPTSLPPFPAGTTASEKANAAGLLQYLLGPAGPAGIDQLAALWKLNATTYSTLLATIPSVTTLVSTPQDQARVIAGLHSEFSWGTGPGPTSICFNVGSFTGAGCVILALTGIEGFAVALLFGQQATQNVNAVPWEQAMAATIYNEMAIISAGYASILTALNSTVYALESEADAAAVSQLSSASFNIYQDLANSTVAAQLDSISNAENQYAGGAFHALFVWLASNWNGGGSLHTSTDRLAFPGTANLESATQYPSNVTNVWGVSVGGGAGSNPTHVYAWIPAGISFNVSFATVAAPLTLHAPYPIFKADGVTPAVTPDITWTKGQIVAFPYPAGVYELNESSSSVTARIEAQGILPMNPGVNSVNVLMNGGPALIGCGVGSQFGGVCSALSDNWTSLASIGDRAPINASVLQFCAITNPCGSHNNTPLYHLGTSVWAFSATVYTHLAYLATTSAQVYWTFLKNQGYTQFNIPAACIIPFPSQVLPPAVTNGVNNLSVSQLTALYEAWMNGLARFFSAPPGANATFCSGHPLFTLQGSTWTNLAQIVDGYVFIANTTLFPGETFKNGTGLANTVLSTWAVNGSASSQVYVNGTTNGQTISCWAPQPPTTAPAKLVNISSCGATKVARDSKNATQLVLWALTGTNFRIPLNRTFVVPFGTPIAAFVPGDGVYYTLFGNGTTTGYPLGSHAGSSLYLTYCSVSTGSGASVTVTVTNPCNVTLSTISGSLANVTNCAGGPGQCQAAGGGAGGLTGACGTSFVVWTTFVSAWASVTGTSPLGCLAAEALAIISLVVVAIVVIALVAVVFREL